MEGFEDIKLHAERAVEVPYGGTRCVSKKELASGTCSGNNGGPHHVVEHTSPPPRYKICASCGYYAWC